MLPKTALPLAIVFASAALTASALPHTTHQLPNREEDTGHASQSKSGTGAVEQIPPGSPPAEVEASKADLPAVIAERREAANPQKNLSLSHFEGQKMEHQQIMNTALDAKPTQQQSTNGKQVGDRQQVAHCQREKRHIKGQKIEHPQIGGKDEPDQHEEENEAETENENDDKSEDENDDKSEDESEDESEEERGDETGDESDEGRGGKETPEETKKFGSEVEPSEEGDERGAHGQESEHPASVEPLGEQSNLRVAHAQVTQHGVRTQSIAVEPPESERPQRKRATEGGPGGQQVGPQKIESAFSQRKGLLLHGDRKRMAIRLVPDFHQPKRQDRAGSTRAHSAQSPRKVLGNTLTGRHTTTVGQRIHIKNEQYPEAHGFSTRPNYDIGQPTKF